MTATAEKVKSYQQFINGKQVMGETYRTWKEFEEIENRKVGTFQLSIDELAKDMYVDTLSERDDEEEIEELDFDHF